jgi:ABC-type dipeptide/oligopeptide/nickel transport system ATPase component
MSNLVIVLGSSGTGKSTSIKTLNPQETVILNVLGKDLPFKGSRANYTREKKNLIQSAKWDSISSMMQSISKNMPNIHNIVIDDAIYIMRTEFFDRSNERGFDKYNELADHFRRIIADGNSLRKDITVFMMLHTETVEADGSVIGYKASTVGKLLDKMYNPLESVSITLFAQPKYDDKGRPEFGFYTHPMKVNGIEIPAKSPAEMFEEDFIPNSLQLVLDKMKEYYGE